MIAKFNPGIWFTADPHFGHANIIQYSGRLFKNLPEMDEQLTARWNQKVGPDDKIYVIGDFTLNGPDAAAIYFSRLNGNISVLPGDHDYRWMEADKYISKSNYLVRVLPPLVTLNYDKIIDRQLSIVLCHYAMRVWPKSHYGTYQLYGHSHGKLPGNGRQWDVGVDAHDFYPWSLVDIIELLEHKKNHGELDTARTGRVQH